MGITKTEGFTASHNTTATLFKALGHPARVAIMEYLVQSKECICGDFVRELPLAQPTISQHLKELREAGLINGTVCGKTVCYCINPEVINTLNNYFHNIHHQLSGKKETCCP